MPFIAFPGVVQVAVIQAIGTNPVVNVHHVYVGTPTVDLTQMGEVADVYEEWLTETLPDHLHLGWHADSLHLVDLTTEASFVLDRALTGIVGALSGTPLPPQDCICISLRSGFAGRSKRGRTYISGLTSTSYIATDASQLNSTFRAALTADVQVLMDALQVAGFSMVVASRANPTGSPLQGQAHTVITALSATAKVAAQRGRNTP